MKNRCLLRRDAPGFPPMNNGRSPGAREPGEIDFGFIRRRHPAAASPSRTNDTSAAWRITLHRPMALGFSSAFLPFFVARSCPRFPRSSPGRSIFRAFVGCAAFRPNERMLVRLPRSSAKFVLLVFASFVTLMSRTLAIKLGPPQNVQRCACFWESLSEI
mgnify:CR=1 FL=1